LVCQIKLIGHPSASFLTLTNPGLHIGRDTGVEIPDARISRRAAAVVKMDGSSRPWQP
jgi:hypothetical protein